MGAVTAAINDSDDQIPECVSEWQDHLDIRMREKNERETIQYFY